MAYKNHNRNFVPVIHKMLCFYLLVFVSIPSKAFGTPGEIKKIAGNLDVTNAPAQTFYGDGQSALNAGIYQPRSVWVDHESNIFIADTSNHRIRKITPDAIITTVAGNGTEGFSGDGGFAVHARLSKPYDICGDNQGNLYIADMGNNRIRKIDPQEKISTVAGSGMSVRYLDNWPPAGDENVNDEGPATQALLGMPMGICLDESGNLYIADTAHNRVRRVDTSGTITTVVGKGFGSRERHGELGVFSYWRLGRFGGDGGKATEAYLKYPTDICLDKDRNLYIADAGNHRIRKVDHQTGIITTVAGNGNTFRVHTGGFHYPSLDIGKLDGEENLATSISLNFPMSVHATDSGHLLIADAHNHRIRAVFSRSQLLKTIAGVTQPGSSKMSSYPEFVLGRYLVDGPEADGYSGDNGPAVDAQFSVPSRISVDQRGDLYIADTGNHRIRVVENIEQTIVSFIGSSNIIRADFNGDKQISFLDFVIFVRHFNTEEGDSNFDAICDLNADGKVGVLDFLRFAEHFGKSY